LKLFLQRVDGRILLPDLIRREFFERPHAPQQTPEPKLFSEHRKTVDDFVHDFNDVPSTSRENKRKTADEVSERTKNRSVRAFRARTAQGGRAITL
jgi:hypothetical protein